MCQYLLDSRALKYINNYCDETGNFEFNPPKRFIDNPKKSKKAMIKIIDFGLHGDHLDSKVWISSDFSPLNFSDFYLYKNRLRQGMIIKSCVFDPELLNTEEWIFKFSLFKDGKFYDREFYMMLEVEFIN